MTTLDLSNKSDTVIPRVSLWKVLSILAGIAASFWAWYAVPATNWAASDYSALRDRVKTLEVQSAADKAERERLRADDQRWRDRVDEKLDRLVEGMGRIGR
jgi:hypothetical protein